MRFTTGPLLATVLIGFTAVSFTTATFGATPDQAVVEFFEKKIRPVLADRCYECHSHQAKKLKGDFYLDSRAGLLKGGETGVAVVLGEPEKSRLIEAIRYSNSDFQMPPKQRLPESVVADFVEWIKMGAPWPEEEAANQAIAKSEADALARKRDHWALRPVRAVKPPPVKESAWPQSSVDRFVLAKLEEKQLRPVPAADRRTLIRRAYFDLIGLPPPIADIEAFVNDPAPDAFAKVVEHLLASPHYGERFARHWLDVARYGEDQAHSFQPRLYPQGFRYRDWLVRAFNSDLPYDRFILEQIAGDLLDDPNKKERLPALGFFAVGPVYYGDRKMFDQLDDRIDTMTRGFLGLTVACARCHDHKFDPITTKDYYALAGVFASTEYVEAPLVSEQVVEAFNKGQSAIQTKTQQIDQFIEKEAARVSEAMTAEIARYITAVWKLQNADANSPKKTVEQIAKEEKLQSSVLDRWSKYLAAPQKTPRSQLARWFELTGKKTESQREAPDSAASKVRPIAEDFQKYVTSVLKLRDALQERNQAALALSDKDEKLALEKPDAALLDELFGKEGLFTIPKSQAEKSLPEKSKARLAELRAELEKAKKNAPAKYAFAHALKEATKPVNLQVLIRGNQDSPGEEVPRRFLSALAGEQPPAFHQGSGRLELAQAIASKDNPLTARVMVNRIWQHHFGQGLVRTPSNFGSLGELPTHPELLDFLADQFIRSGWSVKALHRMIMVSATYQMSSQSNTRNAEIDTENRWLWRMNRRRLEVEAWRDAMLAVSGSLDSTLGGPSFDLASADIRRRTFYGTVSRHDLNSLLRLFDFPDPNVTSDSRTVTTVPLQQLFVLNSEFMVRQAKALVARLTSAVGEDNASRVRRAFLLVYARPPTAQELQLGLGFLAAADLARTETEAGGGGDAHPGGSAGGLSRWEQYAQVLLSANEFMYVD